MQPHAYTSAVIKPLTHDFEIRSEAFEHFLLAADHEGEAAALGAGTRSGAGSVEKFYTFGRQGGCNGATVGRPDGAGVGDGGPGFGALSDAIRSQNHLLHHGSITHAQEDRFGVRGYLLWRRARDAFFLRG